ncbi:D-alanyl-D-alanine carboxypeptidase/D-alanyl-D-alanine endopeptidase [Halomonas sp. V046]|uniref:D-alanyl-D-alanine carboxypeptidase/D-alanyl-D-alanine endopeptidase n=1 Tax=Halomonas sp. V046 TaxID=3459611 RepID=UPI0040439E4A
MFRRLSPLRSSLFSRLQAAHRLAPVIAVRSILLGGLCSVLLASPVQAAGFSRLAELSNDGFLISAEARLLPTGAQPGETLGAISPDRLLTPASVTKVYTAAATLDAWGPQHRFTTELKSTARTGADGTLAGDLVLVGGGDPSLTSEDLWRLTQRLHQSGVRRVTGRLVVSQARFGPVACATTDRCRALERSDNAYSALLTSAGVNYGSWCVQVAPGAVGGPARITGCNSQTPLFAVDNRVTTQAANAGTSLDALRVADGGVERLTVSGTISANALPQEVYRASADPAHQTAETLAAMLSRSGIVVDGGSATSMEPAPASARRLAAVDGKPLQEILLRMLNYSNNYMADVLALDLVTTPRAELDQAGQALEAFVAGVPGHGPVTLESGSGLTTDNKTSAQGANALLEYMFQRPALFPVFAAGLQAPANGPMRFIRRGSSTFQSHVMLKTGTLNQPVAVRAVTGYFRTASHRWGVFSVLVNGTASTPYISWSRVLDLASLDLDRMISDH